MLGAILKCVNSRLLVRNIPLRKIMFQYNVYPFKGFFGGLIDGYTILKGCCGALYATMHKKA